MDDFNFVTNITKVTFQSTWIIYRLFRMAEMGASVLNSKVAPVVDRAISAIRLGKKAFKFTKIDLGNAKPQFKNFRFSQL